MENSTLLILVDKLKKVETHSVILGGKHYRDSWDLREQEEFETRIYSETFEGIKW